MSRLTHRRVVDALFAGSAAIARAVTAAALRLRRPALIVIGSVIALMLLIVVLQSGLGVDSDDTITDSQRPEIVGGE